MGWADRVLVEERSGLDSSVQVGSWFLPEDAVADCAFEVASGAACVGYMGVEDRLGENLVGYALLEMPYADGTRSWF